VTGPDPIDRARELRQSQTPPEGVLWSKLRAGRLAGLKFRRQHPIGPYTVDFYCASAKLVVEIDGRVHDDRERAQRDRARNAWMCDRGLVVLRIPASEVSRDLDAVLRTIHGKAVRAMKAESE
jgi:very-short-patch-repair endonuclease